VFANTDSALGLEPCWDLTLHKPRAMTQINSVSAINLEPIPGKQYWNTDRIWSEEFIYFLLVDRFDDNRSRKPLPSPNRAQGSQDLPKLKNFCGGKIKGIEDNLNYIKNLGCTAIWLSPIFENNDAPNLNSDKYHGYSIQNYLDIDPRFGTKQDLLDLVDAAHKLDMRIILDVVLNHTGNNWAYPNDYPYFYSNDQQFSFGSWRQSNRPLPSEIRNQDFYHRRGQITNWDNYPEYETGDFFDLKDFNNSEDPNGLELQELMIKAHCYWLREADIDGFRMDAVKHIGSLASARFASAIREYAYRLGKKQFFLFGELVAGDDAVNRFVGPNTSTQTDDKTVFFGLTSVLDFPLYWVLPGVIKGFLPPQQLFGRYEAQRKRALSQGELGRYLVTFIDNHDQIGPDPKRRFGADSPDQQIIAGIGYLLCALGTPCIYYGTEQGFSGKGSDDALIREPMFDLTNSTLTFLNPDSTIYKSIAAIAAVFNSQPSLKFGRIYFREISGNGVDFGLPEGHPCTLAFSRILGFKEILIAYNTSTTTVRNDWVIVDRDLHSPGQTMTFLYGDTGNVTVQSHPDPNNSSHFVQLSLQPMQFVILA
jgi:glycosidase